MKTQLKKSLDETFDDLIKTVSACHPEQINSVPFVGSWTPGQTSAHIVISALGIIQTLKGATETAHRNSDEKALVIEELFLDFTKKFEAREFIQPTSSPHDKQTILNSFSEIERSLAEITETQDLSLLCLDFQIPEFGYFTGQEWIVLIITHTQRHIHQLKNIIQKLNG